MASVNDQATKVSW